MIVVSDTTPLISLMKIGQLELLEKMFGEIVIPDAVYNELTSNEDFAGEADAIKNSNSIKRVSIKERRVVDVLQRATGLDLGESEAIVYSDENKADLLMMDESSGRRVAKQMNIPVIGTIGILELANSRGILSADEIKNCVDILRTSRRYISEELLQHLLSVIK